MILLIALSLSVLSAQKVVTVNGTQIDLEGLEELDNMSPGTKNVKIMINKEYNPMADESGLGYFGIYVEDLNFPKAQKLNYTKNFGVLITGVVPNSPAWDARMQEEDVIVAINGKQVMNKEDFDRQRKNMRAGDTLSIMLWRSGAEFSIEMVLGSRTTASTGTVPEVTKKKRSYVGYGGGGWTPTWLQTDMTDINKLMSDLDLKEYDENGVLTQGFAGKGHIGKGFFLGFQVNGFDDSRTKRDTLSAGGPYDLNVKYNLSLVGATIDKRFAIAPWLITSLGVMLGGGSHEVDFTRINQHYEWPTSLETVSQGSFNAKLRRGYLMVQPRAELMIRFLPWLGLRGEAGYAYTYAPYKGWRVQGEQDGEMVEVHNSPSTKLEGLTIGIGPWFGF